MASKLQVNADLVWHGAQPPEGDCGRPSGRANRIVKFDRQGLTAHDKEVRVVDPETTRFPLLEAILIIKDLPLRPMYTTRQAAEVFNVSSRTLQYWIAQGKLVARELPGRARFLPCDLEAFLERSRKEPK